MKVLVSACLMGINCKYNGKNNLNPALIEYLKDKEVLQICPELLAGLPIPRSCAEMVNGVIMDVEGNNVHSEYRYGVQLALEKIKDQNIDLIVLQSRSPTCGVNQIYDGTFTGELITGQGIFAKALLDLGYNVKDSEDFT